MSDEEAKKTKQPGPDFYMRVGPEKAEWQAMAKEAGFDSLAAYVKFTIREDVKKRKKKAQGA